MTDSSLIPRHVAFIMDGNRRWAREHRLSLFLGHETGSRRLEPLVEYAMGKGIEYLTFWAFSTENWNREEQEVEDLLEVFRKALRDTSIQKLHEKNVRIHAIGELTRFPQDIQDEVAKLIETSQQNTGITVILALNYGGRAEILSAVKALLESGVPDVSEESFGNYLSTKDYPDPDFIIRTGGEKRLSGYLPWQSVYSELYFTDLYWPDFDEKAFDVALEEYANRQRRFGK